jgi:hypothetical protein
MKTTAFKRGLENAFLATGFRRAGKSLRRDSSEVAVIVEFEKGFGDQWFINAGFWIHSLGEPVPERVEGSHLYFRLERLVPDLRETILAAGALSDEAQEQAYRKLVDLLPDRVVSELEALATEHGLRAAITGGRLTDGLIRKEAREHLGA